jgi:hypothetical protein
VTAIRERYQGGTKDEKLRILDEFVAITGYHRKHAIRLFKAGSTARGASRRSRLPVYDAAVREALVVLWEASDRVCGKRLRPLLPILVSALERHGHLTLAATVRARVLAASAATLDRLLRVAELRKGREFGPTTMIMTSAWRGGPCGSPQRRAGDSSPLRW